MGKSDERNIEASSYANQFRLVIPDEATSLRLLSDIKWKDGFVCSKCGSINFCKGKISSYKLPKEIIIINDLDDMNELPKGPTKKILYRTLEEYYKNIWLII